MIIWDFFNKLLTFLYLVNFPLVKLTSQSRTLSNGWSHLALDKDINTCSIAGSNLTFEQRAWWRVELDGIYNIANVTIANTPRSSCGLYVISYMLHKII